MTISRLIGTTMAAALSFGLAGTASAQTAQMPAKTLPAAQAPTKATPAPQAPAKTMPAPQAPTKTLPAPQATPVAPSKVIPAPQDSMHGCSRQESMPACFGAGCCSPELTRPLPARACRSSFGSCCSPELHGRSQQEHAGRFGAGCCSPELHGRSQQEHPGCFGPDGSGEECPVSLWSGSGYAFEGDSERDRRPASSCEDDLGGTRCSDRGSRRRCSRTGDSCDRASDRRGASRTPGSFHPGCEEDLISVGWVDFQLNRAKPRSFHDRGLFLRPAQA